MECITHCCGKECLMSNEKFSLLSQVRPLDFASSIQVKSYVLRSKILWGWSHTLSIWWTSHSRMSSHWWTTSSSGKSLCKTSLYLHDILDLDLLQTLYRQRASTYWNAEYLEKFDYLLKYTILRTLTILEATTTSKKKNMVQKTFVMTSRISEVSFYQMMIFWFFV